MAQPEQEPGPACSKGLGRPPPVATLIPPQGEPSSTPALPRGLGTAAPLHFSKANLMLLCG